MQFGPACCQFCWFQVWQPKISLGQAASFSWSMWPWHFCKMRRSILAIATFTWRFPQWLTNKAPRVVVETPVDSEYCSARQSLQSQLKKHGFQLEDFEHGRGSAPSLNTLGNSPGPSSYHVSPPPRFTPARRQARRSSLASRCVRRRSKMLLKSGCATGSFQRVTNQHLWRSTIICFQNAGKPNNRSLHGQVQAVGKPYRVTRTVGEPTL
jgi:hypothetical protein